MHLGNSNPTHLATDDDSTCNLSTTHNHIVYIELCVDTRLPSPRRYGLIAYTSSRGRTSRCCHTLCHINPEAPIHPGLYSASQPRKKNACPTPHRQRLRERATKGVGNFGQTRRHYPKSLDYRLTFYDNVRLMPAPRGMLFRFLVGKKRFWVGKGASQSV